MARSVSVISGPLVFLLDGNGTRKTCPGAPLKPGTPSRPRIPCSPFCPFKPGMHCQ